MFMLTDAGGQGFFLKSDLVCQHIDCIMNM